MKTSPYTPLVRLAMITLIINAVLFFPVLAADTSSGEGFGPSQQTCQAGTGTGQGITTQIDPAPLLGEARENEKFASMEKRLTDTGYTQDEIVAFTITRDNGGWNVLHIHYTAESKAIDLWFSRNPDTGEIAIVEGTFEVCNACVFKIITGAAACTGICLWDETLIAIPVCLICIAAYPTWIKCDCWDCGCRTGNQEWCDRHARDCS